MESLLGDECAYSWAGGRLVDDQNEALETSNKVLLFNRKKKELCEGPSLNIARHGHSSTALGKNTFVIGGNNACNVLEVLDTSQAETSWRIVLLSMIPELTEPQLYPMDPE